MAELIDKGAIYNKVAELEELARSRVLDTSSNNPCYMRYVSQLNERTALKHLIADTEATTETEIRAKAIDDFAEKAKGLFSERNVTVFEWNKLVDDIAEQLKGE